MRITNQLVGLSILAAAALGSSVVATAIGQEVADQISANSFMDILSNELYTHLGDNKGVGGAQHDPCRNNIQARFESYGLTVELDPFVYQSTTYHNVVATHAGTRFPDQQYIIGAHYDTVNNPGADDDASGVALMLEIARVLSQYETDITIKFIAFDREEQGKVGSTAYVAEHAGEQILGMVQIDMIAHDVGMNTQDMWGNAASAPLRQLVLTAINEYGNGTNAIYAGPATFSDHAPFATAGYQAFAFVEHSFAAFGCYHQPCDAVDTPNYIHPEFASNLARSLAGFLADNAGVNPDTIPADINGDGVVNGLDLGILLANWSIPPAAPGCAGALPCAADLNGDTFVNGLDLGILLAGWTI